MKLVIVGHTNGDWIPNSNDPEGEVRVKLSRNRHVLSHFGLQITVHVCIQIDN